MNIKHFDKAVRQGARQIEAAAESVTPVAEGIAPAFKLGTMAVVAAYAAPVAPYLAPLPPQLFLPPMVALPLLLFSQPFREGIAEHVEKRSAPEAASALFSHLLAPKPG